MMDSRPLLDGSPRRQSQVSLIASRSSNGRWWELDHDSAAPTPAPQPPPPPSRFDGFATSIPVFAAGSIAVSALTTQTRTSAKRLTTSASRRTSSPPGESAAMTVSLAAAAATTGASRSQVARRSLVVAVFTALFCGLLVGNLYQGVLLDQLAKPMIRLRARQPDVDESRHEVALLDGTPGTATTKYEFDWTGRDVIVFIQIQCAGANFFEKHLLEDLDIAEKPCTCFKKNRSDKRKRKVSKCRCRSGYDAHSTSLVDDTPWLFSRLSGGWRCGVHPDWTQLTACVDKALDEAHGEPVKRRYMYTTILREPIRRFRSEWLRYIEQRGPRPFRHLCGGQEHSLPDIQECFRGRNPADVTLEEFALCKDNLARNRQTRMLADLRLVGCYDTAAMNQTQRNMILLHSAKNNLHRMAFFGLAEFPNVSQRMFEAAFGVHFRSRPNRRFNRLSSYLKNGVSRGSAGASVNSWSTRTEAAVRQANDLDLELYEYAKELLFERFHHLFKEGPGEDEDPSWADGDDLVMERR